MDDRYAASPFAMIGARSSRHIVAFFHAASQSSRARSQDRAKLQTHNLPPNPHIRTQHCSTAELPAIGIQTGRTERLTEEPSPESNDPAMSRLRTRENLISPFVGRIISRAAAAVDSSTAVIAHGFWAHIGSIPWATSNRQTSQLALRRGASRTARNLFTPLPYRL